jgi:hypothetical protein
MSCCCGKYDITDESLTINTTKHEPLGEGNFCGPTWIHDIRELETRIEVLTEAIDSILCTCAEGQEFMNKMQIIDSVIKTSLGALFPEGSPNENKSIKHICKNKLRLDKDIAVKIIEMHPDFNNQFSILGQAWRVILAELDQVSSDEEER